MTINDNCPRLIEVALPIREISAESVRDKSLRHGHISTLHLWWARRPLAAARAIVFASLVPDPDDPRCPPEFRSRVETLLKTQVPSILRQYQRKNRWLHDVDPYRPYAGIPDTLRNRLLMFVAKWSPEWQKYELGMLDKQPVPAETLDDRSLVKWETSDPENSQGREVLRIARELVQAAYGSATPTVLDPFAGGAAIPLEAGRLQVRAIANDYNPVAHLIERATCEFPQKYSKSGKRRIRKEGREQEITVPNVLVHDIGKWANWILDRAKAKIGHLYPRGKDGLIVVGYLWSRTAPCSNPSCRAQIPLLKSLLVCDKSGKKIALSLQVDREHKTINFGIVKGKNISRTEGTMIEKGRGNARCPICQQVVAVADLKRAFLEGRSGERIVAVIVDAPGGKDYRPVEQADLQAFAQAAKLSEDVERPREPMPVEYTQALPSCTWGFTTWGSLFNPRQLVSMQTFVACLQEALVALKREVTDEEYYKAIAIYLGLWISRISQRSSNMGIWHRTRETLEHPFGRQAIPLAWDYPEANPFSESTGGAEGGIDWMVRVITREITSSPVTKIIRGDGANLPLASNSVDVVITDPPYFDAIAYADLSDYFYVWLKRALADVVPEIFVTPLTPKIEEATALKHRHNGDESEADRHFVKKLAQALAESKRTLRADGVISIMFAHQSTKAWSALIRAIFDAGLTVEATWAIDTELTTALKSWKSALASSVTVTCRPRIVGSAASLRTVRREIEKAVAEAVKRFWNYGFRGADLLVACYGPAVGVFGKYARVEKADGTPVEVPELLELAREAARNAIAGEFDGDDLSTLYYVWANLYGAAEQAWDDARLVVQIGGERADAMEVARRSGIFVLDGNQCRLALLADRALRRDLGEDPTSPLIDILHRAMLYWKQEDRNGLLRYLVDRDLLSNDPFWKLAQSLFDTMPRDIEDWKITSALLSERETLRMQARGMGRTRSMQSTLDLE